MRELKFRVWDKIGEVFRGNLYKYLINADTGKLEVWAFSDLYDEWYNTHEDGEHLVVQQYTGLKDCSGKDIYEGDIVSYEAGEPNRNDGSFYKSISEVKFENGAFWPRPMKEECEDSWYDYELKNICIIGNIFENPELLGAKQLLR